MVKGSKKVKRTKKVAVKAEVVETFPAIVKAVPPAVQQDRVTDVQVNPQALIAAAIEKGLPLESIERLLAMRKELKAEWAKEQYFAALSEFQSLCPNIIKDKDVFDGKGALRYSYAPLDVIVTAVKGPLKECGFSYTIITAQTDKDVTAECHAHHADGHSEVSKFTIPMDPKAYMNESQKIASAMTYAKRYAFCNAFGIMTSDADDDSNSTGEAKPKPVASPQPREGVKVEENGKKIDDAKVDIALVSARREVQEIFTKMARKIADVDGNSIALYTLEELNAMKEQAKAETADIEKLRGLAIEWTSDYTTRLADKGFGKEGI
jgi:hypothetical protein